jgi:general secretion pathway protein I
MSPARTDIPRGEAGFSLVEALVALFVLAVAGVGLMQMQSQSVSTQARVEARVLAGLVAQDALVEAMASLEPVQLGVRSGEMDLAGRRWGWSILTTPTADPAIVRLTARAGLAAGNEAVPPLSEITAFRRAGGGG